MASATPTVVGPFVKATASGQQDACVEVAPSPTAAGQSATARTSTAPAAAQWAASPTA
ncbi:DUF397 domain-containing protein [Streptomyces cyaneofuscatus]|uniref:DUF397 domain-containing protein n=1 Tax=Streptomyces cyaneofuscatus TaxID=66883 RepID=UPI0036781CD3